MSPHVVALPPLDAPSWSVLEQLVECELGGTSESLLDMSPVQRTAIIVPYRNRSAHLRRFLLHMHPYLQRQEINYRIFVVNQVGGKYVVMSN